MYYLYFCITDPSLILFYYWLILELSKMFIQSSGSQRWKQGLGDPPKMNMNIWAAHLILFEIFGLFYTFN